LEQKRRLEIEAQENARKDAARQHENKMAREQIEHSTNMEILREKQEVAKTVLPAFLLSFLSLSLSLSLSFLSLSLFSLWISLTPLS